MIAAHILIGLIIVVYVAVWLIVWHLVRQNDRLLELNEKLVFSNKKLLDIVIHQENARAPTDLEDYDEYNHSDCAL